MSSDPLIEKLPISNNLEEGIDELAGMLGYSEDTFKRLLKSLLIEELLDRLRPTKEEIRELRMRPNHLELLKQRMETMTKVEWPIEIVEHFWQRIRLLDDNFKREPIPFHRKLQVLATKPVFDTTDRFEAIRNRTVMPTLLNIKIQSTCFGIPLTRAVCKGGHVLEIVGVDTGCTPYHEV